MAVMTNLLLRRDSAASDVTLVPKTDRPFPSWRTDVDGESELQAITLDAQWEKMKSGKTRVNVKLNKPIMEVVPAGTVNASGVQAAPRVADIETISVTMITSSRGTQTTRADLLRLMVHLLSGASSVTATYHNPATAAVDTYKGSTSPLVFGLIHQLMPGG